VHPDVAREAFELLGERKQLARLFLALFSLGQARLHRSRVLQRDALAGLERDELGELVGARVAPLHDAADVAHHRARSHGAESGDLRDGLRPVFLFDVVDHPVAAAFAEIDVEVGHRHTLRVEKALEQQVVAQRVEVGDAQRIRDQRPRARAAPRTHRHAVRLRPVDEIGDDEEVSGEAHLDDRPQLELQPRVVFLPLIAGLGAEIRLEPAGQPLAGLLAEEFLEGHALRRREGGQLGLAELQREVAALRDMDRVLERLGQVGEQLRHFGLAEEPALAREGPGAAAVAEHVPFGDAHARLVRGEILLAQELHRMGRDYGKGALAREPKRRLDVVLRLGRPGALQLEVVAAGKQACPFGGDLPGATRVLEQRGADLARDRARQRDQAFGPLGEPALPHLGAAAVLVLQPGARQQLGQPEIPGARLHQQKQAVRLVALGLVGDPDVAADDRLHARGARRLVELDHAEHVGEVGDRQRRHAVRGRALDRVVDAHDPVGDRELAVEPKVDEGGIRHRGNSGRKFYRGFENSGRFPRSNGHRAGERIFMTLIKGIVALFLAAAVDAARAELDEAYRQRNDARE